MIKQVLVVGNPAVNQELKIVAVKEYLAFIQPPPSPPNSAQSSDMTDYDSDGNIIPKPAKPAKPPLPSPPCIANIIQEAWGNPNDVIIEVEGRPEPEALGDAIVEEWA